MPIQTASLKRIWLLLFVALWQKCRISWQFWRRKVKSKVCKTENGFEKPIVNIIFFINYLNNLSSALPQHHVQDKNPPTVAIVTCLFPEKQSIDTIIENGITKHSHSKSGDSNVYTIGKIAGHNVVATKV
jgi:hypothetical protein